MKGMLKLVGVCLTAGLVGGAGARIAEHLIPAPSTRVIVCTPSEMRQPICKPLDELMKATIKSAT